MTRNEAHELNLGLREGAFLEFHVEMVLAKPSQDLLQLLQMFFQGLVVHDDVVYIDVREVRHVRERESHCALKGGRCVLEPERHYLPLVGTELRLKGGLVLVTLVNTNLMEPAAQVHFRKELATFSF